MENDMLPTAASVSMYERVLRLVRDYLAIVIIIAQGFALYHNHKTYREVVADRDKEKQQTIEYLRENYRLSQQAFLETLKKQNDESRQKKDDNP